MIMCVLLCYPVSIHISQLLSTGRPISSFLSSYDIMNPYFPYNFVKFLFFLIGIKIHCLQMSCLLC